tara:strand:- start:96 stop:758 length:663 start_codon:yes stop_codon:yes gene_type:complete
MKKKTNIIDEDIIYDKENYMNNKKILNKLLTNKEKYYYDDLHQFYKSIKINNIEKIIQIINTQDKISLRILDWFITKYSNDNKTTYKLDDDDNNDIGFIVHIGYKSQLKTYKKKYFDPFRRYKKFFYYYKYKNGYRRFETTLGQLNFFKWALKKNIINYVQNNYDALVNSMNLSNKEDKERKKNKEKIKDIKSKSIDDTYSSISTDKRTTNSMKIILSFD